MGRCCNSKLSYGTKNNNQITFESYDLLNKLFSQVAAGDANYADPNINQFREYIDRRNNKDAEGKFDFVAHGSSKTVNIYVNGNPHTVNWRVVANIIRHSKEYHGQDIRLLSCNTGRLSNGFAQNLANKLKVKVYAPSTTIWATKQGEYYIADKYGDPHLNFVEFIPRRK